MCGTMQYLEFSNGGIFSTGICWKTRKMSTHSDDDIYIPPGQGAGGHERDDPIHYRASRNPSRRSFYDNPYTDYPYDPRPPRNPYPYAPFRDYPIEYQRYPYRSPPPRIIYLKDHPNSSRHANKDMPGRKPMKRKSSDLLESIHQLIKKSKNTPGPSQVRPGAPRAPASSTGSTSRSDSRIDSDDNQGSEEGELLSDTYIPNPNRTVLRILILSPLWALKIPQHLLLQPFVRNCIIIFKKLGKKGRMKWI